MSMIYPSFALINGANTYSYDSALDRRRYEINRATVYQSWTDANWIEHRPIVRQRVRGELHLGFKDKSVYDSFLTRLAAGRNADGYNSVSLLVNNSGAVETINAFLTVTDSGAWDVANEREWHDVTVRVEER